MRRIISYAVCKIMSYGRHQSFYLKKHWINKGINAIKIFGSDIFFDQDGYKSIGLGKNMHQALKFWLEATNVLDLVPDQRRHGFTLFGNLLSKNDSSCSKPISLCLVQYFLSIDDKPNKFEKSDSNFWFFNEYDESIFTKEKLRDDLLIYDQGKTSENTISKEIDCLINTYINDLRSHPEDKNISLLAPLQLIRKQNNYYIKNALNKDYYSHKAFYYIILRMNENSIPLSIDNIVTHKNSLGKIFNLSRVEVIDIIEEMIINGYSLGITRTNNLDTVKLLKKETSENFIKTAYELGREV